MEIPCEYIFIGPHKLIERLEKCLDLKENPAVRKDSLSSENVEKKRGRVKCLFEATTICMMKYMHQYKQKR